MARGHRLFQEKTLNSEKKNTKTPVAGEAEVEVHIPDIIWYRCSELTGLQPKNATMCLTIYV